jgi:hypothetical protein
MVGYHTVKLPVDKQTATQMNLNRLSSLPMLIEESLKRYFKGLNSNFITLHNNADGKNIHCLRHTKELTSLVIS